jgi:hypothetical protein
MDFNTLTTLAAGLPADIAILMRGPTGVGKSQVARKIAADLALPYIDVRASTMDEASAGGLPDFETSKTRGVATFVLPSWYVRACREPVVIMIDEFNRAMPQVMQSFFQVILDRELGNNVDGVPMRLHPGTRVFAAINHGNEYDVSAMDPALLRRFFVVDVKPTPGQWIEWAKGKGIDPVLVDFIRQNEAHWRVEPSSVAPGTVIPTPASWDRLDQCLKALTWKPSELAGSLPPAGFHGLCTGMVGTEAAMAFAKFIKDYSKVITAADVLGGKVTAKELKGQEASTITAIIERLKDHAAANTWTAKEAESVATFLRALGGENFVHGWNVISTCNNLGNVARLHALIGKEVVALVQASKAVK